MNMMHQKIIIGMLFAAIFVNPSLIGATEDEGQESQSRLVAKFKEMVEQVRLYMEKDLGGCVGVQKTIEDLSFSSLRKPDGDCKAKCEAEELVYSAGHYKYSGASVLCCCSKEEEQAGGRLGTGGPKVAGRIKDIDQTQ